MVKNSKETQELLEYIREKTGIPFKAADQITFTDGSMHLCQSFGESSYENMVSLHINDETVEVGLYDMFNEHSIYKTERKNIDLILDIAKHIYETNN